MRGQTYDGAGAMAGKTKEVAARITALYPKAQHTHCAAHHRLNLYAINAAVSLKSIM